MFLSGGLTDCCNKELFPKWESYHDFKLKGLLPTMELTLKKKKSDNDLNGQILFFNVKM